MIEFARQAAVDEITHGQLERELSTRMREVTRVLFQDHLDLREVREERVNAPVADHEGISRNRIERHRRTGLDTVFGPVAVHRIAYRGDYVHDLHLLDASGAVDVAAFQAADAEVDQLDGGFVGREVSGGLEQFAQRPVPGLDRVRRVDHPADVLVEVQERDERLPRAFEGVDQAAP